MEKIRLPPLLARAQTAPVLLAEAGASVSAVALPAGAEAILGAAPPDAYRAYIAGTICTSAPFVTGPLSGGGGYMTHHPRALARNAGRLINQQVTFMHEMRAYGSPQDNLIGTVLAASYQGGDDDPIPATAAEAKGISYLAVLHRLKVEVAPLVTALAATTDAWTVSIEIFPDPAHLYVWHGGTREIRPLAAAKTSDWGSAISEDANGYLNLGKLEDGQQLALMNGGEGDAPIPFAGLGVVDIGAEEVAEISALIARGKPASPSLHTTAAPHAIGARIPIDSWRGTVEQVHLSGSHRTPTGVVYLATAARPVYTIRPDGKNYTVLRYAE